MKQLIWVIDSPFSRATKWLLLQQNIPHNDHLLTWDTMQRDALLAKHNPKHQVPTLITESETQSDSLLIALHLLGHDWHRSLDAKLFRLADCDFEATLIFLFRANLLEKQFGASRESKLMREAGVSSYQKNCDVLLDSLLPNPLAHYAKTQVGIGFVLVFSMLLISRHMANCDAIRHYRLDELQPLQKILAGDPSYQKLINNYAHEPSHHWPFFLEAL